MDEPGERKVSFMQSLQALLKAYQFFGLVNFTYNRRKNRVELSKRKQRIMTLVLLHWAFCCVLFASLLVVATMFFLDDENHTLIDWETDSIRNQIIFKTTSPLLLIVSYFKYRVCFVNVINRIITLSERVEKLTSDNSLYYPGRLRKFIVIRMLMFFMNWVTCRDGKNRFNLIVCLVLVFSYGLLELTFWVHVYANLVLICFCRKMINLLDVQHNSIRKKKKRCVRAVISVSCEIHDLKKMFNDVFSLLHFLCFCSFLTDIASLYALLKMLFVLRLGIVHMTRVMVVTKVFKIIFCKYSALQNLFLTSHVAEALVESGRMLQHKILSISYSDDALKRDLDIQREIEMGLLHHNVQDLFTRAFNLFVIKRSSLFAFLMDIVITYAIVMFQQFAGGYIWVAHQQLDVLNRSVVSL